MIGKTWVIYKDTNQGKKRWKLHIIYIVFFQSPPTCTWSNHHGVVIALKQYKHKNKKTSPHHLLNLHNNLIGRNFFH